MLAEAHHAVGDTQAALGTVEAALQLTHDSGEAYWDAELTRLKAVYLLETDPANRALAEELLQGALADATRRGAVSLALRAATTLARLQPVPDSLGAALAAVEGGAGTADVREARDLLDSLSPNALEAEEVP
jgi:predicted ATPase